MAVNPQLGYSLQNCFRNLSGITAFSDFTVIVEGVSFQCHKVMLNACSGYFQALFRSQRTDCPENRADLQGVNKDAFAVIFDSLYKGIGGLTKENIIKVWHASVHLQIAFMTDECERFVKQVMTVSNCLEFYNHANQLHSKNIKSFSFNFVCFNFEFCISDVGFNQLPAIQVYNILQNDHLKARCEDSVVRVILNWINYKEKSSSASAELQAGIASKSTDDIFVNTTTVDRKQYVVKLLSAVHLCLVSNKCLRELLEDDIIMSCRAAREMINRAVDYKLSVKHRHGPWPDTAVHRATSEMSHAMVFASDATINIYLLKDGSYLEYTTLPDKQMASLAVFNNVLYVNNWKTLHMYTHDKVWNKLLENKTSRNKPTRRNMLLSYGSYIYCIDTTYGRLQRVNCMHGYHKQWTECVSAISYVESMIKYKDYILLFGTLNGTVTILLFDPDRNKHSVVSPSKPISGPLDGMVSFTCDENVFVLQKNGNLWKIVSGKSFEVNFEFQCGLWGFTWQIYGSVVYQKQLFIFGSINCEHKPKDFQWPTSLPGIIENVNVVQIQSDTPCLPIVVDLNMAMVAVHSKMQFYNCNKDSSLSDEEQSVKQTSLQGINKEFQDDTCSRASYPLMAQVEMRKKSQHGTQSRPRSWNDYSVVFDCRENPTREVEDNEIDA